MKVKGKYYVLSFFEKLLFRFTYLTIVTIIGISLSFILLAWETFNVYFNHYSPWIYLNFIFVLVITTLIGWKTKTDAVGVGFFAGPLFIPVFMLLCFLSPVKVPSYFVALHKEGKVNLKFCRIDCDGVDALLNEGYDKTGTKFYSHRYAHFLDYFTANPSCCSAISFYKTYYLEGVLLLLETTFVLFPGIFISCIIYTITEFSAKSYFYKDEKDFLIKNKLKKGCKTFSISLILIIIIYNIFYILNIPSV
jgi:hypothetical protein